MGDESGGVLPTITEETVKDRKKDTPETILKRKMIALEKEVEELKKKLKEPVILSKRSDSKTAAEDLESQLSAGEAVIIGRRRGVL